MSKKGDARDARVHSWSSVLLRPYHPALNLDICGAREKAGGGIRWMRKI
jgi:hypothetical protein